MLCCFARLHLRPFHSWGFWGKLVTRGIGENEWIKCLFGQKRREWGQGQHKSPGYFKVWCQRGLHHSSGSVHTGKRLETLLLSSMIIALYSLFSWTPYLSFCPTFSPASFCFPHFCFFSMRLEGKFTLWESFLKCWKDRTIFGGQLYSMSTGLNEQSYT